jgi:hypothetical protein
MNGQHSARAQGIHLMGVLGKSFSVMPAQRITLLLADQRARLSGRGGVQTTYLGVSII